MENKIAIVLPVRDGGLGRHARLSRCLKSYYEMTEGLSDIHLLHDEDECNIYHPIAEQYPQIINYCIPIGISLMQKINVHALDIASKYKYVGFIGDDIVFKTIFESPFIQQLSSVDYGMVYGNDMVWQGKLATHPFITSNAITAVGFFGCPAVEHNYFDNYWQTIFSQLDGTVYFPGILMEHIHPITGKEVKDEIYDKIYRQLNMDEVKFKRYMDANLAEDLNKIRLIRTK
jgi:hypothetical protein